ncbi:type II toxin-antitoxin system RelE/ParE family toxin [Bifidobacterium sp. ESL0775]|uniref:type II toxin-antitoxin system RelE/ParE family toxin n=1 Tax=Bifidobacterium sp. ESL0775 TaxID=2983230 RepID=UPI0023F88705|nr:type II toxin-antitoxin system RelE/ParE family toxin [Bifidobacterium sp. ESL0775]WEV69600.1 type II toxin-antitoxin system RelE/ParE family toxin [Bifidobacterium sp. ESL0775]
MDDFEVEFYALPDGTEPMSEFLNSLPKKVRVKASRSIALLRQYGNRLREPESKYLDDGIFELRSKQSTNTVRSFYFFIEGRKIIMTHGIVKKQNKTPPAELLKAKKYRDDWLRRKGLKHG